MKDLDDEISDIENIDYMKLRWILLMLDIQSLNVYFLYCKN